MFIYSYYSHLGHESPENLLKHISLKGIKNVCLIDERGMAIPAFLESAIKYEINVSFAIPFSCFIEEREEKEDGYFITSSKNGLELIFRNIENMKEQWIPYVNKKTLEEFSSEKVYTYIKRNEKFIDYFSKAKLEIQPITFLKSDEKETHYKVYGTYLGRELKENEKENEFVSKISTNPEELLRFYKGPKLDIAIGRLIKWNEFNFKERNILKSEISHFRKRNLLLPFYSLHKAKMDGFSFIIHGDMYKSLLAFAIGLIPEKPSYYGLTFSFDYKEKINIVIQKSDRKKMALFLKESFGAKHPFFKLSVTPKKAIEQAAKMLGYPGFGLAMKLKGEESISDFKKRMRVYLLMNEKDREILDLASFFHNKKEEKYKLETNYFVFAGEKGGFVQDEENIFIDKEKMMELNIPSIQCFYPPSELSNIKIRYNKIPKGNFNINEISSFYLEKEYITKK